MSKSDKKIIEALKKRMSKVFEDLEKKGDVAELAKSLGFDRELISSEERLEDNDAS